MFITQPCILLIHCFLWKQHIVEILLFVCFFITFDQSFFKDGEENESSGKKKKKKKKKKCGKLFI